MMPWPHRTKHPWLWGITIFSVILTLIIIAIGIYALNIAPDRIEKQHLCSALKDIGPAVAGSWVLCAALLAITAAGITSIAAATEDEKRDQARLEAINRICIAEIKTFFDRCNQLELHTKLRDHIAWLQHQFSMPAGRADAFRRNFGDDWFVFFRVDPEALGLLDANAGARYLSLSAHARHLTSRLNWLNSCTFELGRNQFWLDYHNDTLLVLNHLYPLASEVLRLLGDYDTDPKTFHF